MYQKKLGEQEIINYLNYCINVKKLCRGTVNYINSTLKFFYVVTLEGSWSDLRVSDIISAEMKIRVRNGKRNKERYTLLSQKNLELLRAYWKKFGYKNYSTDDYLFISRLTKRQLTSRTVQSALDKAVQKAGITRKATPHALRHSFATHLMNDGVDLATIQALMGHSNMKTTSIYLHVKDYRILNIKSPLDTLD